MAGVAGGKLAAAATMGGGLGLIAGGYSDPALLEHEFSEAGNAVVGVGFITWALAKNPEALDVALSHSPKAIFLSFAEIGPYVAKSKSGGAKLIAQVQTVAQARAAAEAGADLIVAQGTEAGGHGAARATLPLVPAVVDAVGDIPVLAAGGLRMGAGWRRRCPWVRLAPWSAPPSSRRKNRWPAQTVSSGSPKVLATTRRRVRSST
jgi:nitronate monooxygenase